MASLVASSNSQMPTVSVQEKGSRNKRKFRADPQLAEPNDDITSPQHEINSYEFSAEKFEVTQDSGSEQCSVSQDHSDGLKLDLGLSSPVSSEVGVSQPKEELEADESHDADWSDLTEAQLEELVLTNLDTIFKSAIKRIVASGYPEEVASKAILRSGICYGCKDTVSNIVDNALTFLRNGEEIIDPLREHCFEDLVQLEKYILAELVCVLREVRPLFSSGDAMWCLLICDMNVSHACAMDTDPCLLGSDDIVDGGSPVQAESESKIEAKIPESSLPSPCKLIRSASDNSQSEKSRMPRNSVANNLKNSHSLGGFAKKEGGAKCVCNSGVKLSNNAGSSQSPVMDEKCGSLRKVHSTTSTKRDYILRQKSFHVEKSYRTYGSKGSSRSGKVSGSLSSLIFDKKLKSVSETTTISLKSGSFKISTSMGVEVTKDNVNVNFSSNGGPSTAFSLDSVSRSTNTLASEDAANTTATASTPTALSATNPDLSLSLSYGSCVGIPYDKSPEKWVPQDKKDEMVLKLVPRLQELHSQLHEWTEWANQKVMQAARRLSKDKAELKALRQEKDEVERLKKEKQCLEENTMKKLSEMENALRKASGQVERANAAVRKLEVENAMLRREMEVAKLHAVESATSCQEVSRREKKTQMTFQTWEKQKSLFQEELMNEKRKLAQLQQDLQQAKVQQEQAEARLQQVVKAKQELLLQAKSLRKEKYQIEVSAKSKEASINSKAEKNLQRHRDDIQKLEKEIAELRLQSDSFKIAALRRGIDGSNAGSRTDTDNATATWEPRSIRISELVAKISDNSSTTVSVKRERECVMCLSEEMSVVFLPCAHQVVCTTCNELHLKRGMQDCPSCRSPIERRILVRYAHA